MPLLVLIEAAKAGNEHQVEEFSQLFHDHANKLIEVSATQQFSAVSVIVFNKVLGWHSGILVGRHISTHDNTSLTPRLSTIMGCCTVLSHVHIKHL